MPIAGSLQIAHGTCLWSFNVHTHYFQGCKCSSMHDCHLLIREGSGTRLLPSGLSCCNCSEHRPPFPLLSCLFPSCPLLFSCSCSALPCPALPHLICCCTAQAHAELPIVLVLGMATSAGALQQMLPVAAASMLEPHHFHLTSSMDRYPAVAPCFPHHTLPCVCNMQPMS